MLKTTLMLALACLLAATPAGGAAAGRPWFTQPMSRLVVNPFMEMPKPAGVPEPALPLHAAYYAGEYPTRLPFLWGFLEGDAAAPDDPGRATGWPALRSLGSGRVPYMYWDGGARNGSITLALQTVFDGPDGLLQKVGGHTPAPVILAGMAPDGGVPHWDARRSALTWSTKQMAFALIIPGGRWLPVAHRRAWAVALSSRDAIELVLSARFAPQPQDIDALVDAAAARADLSAFLEARETGRRTWDDLMARVPHPKDFDLKVLTRPHLDGSTIRPRYEAAWTFVISDTLPPMPENGYPYPQVACGKPSLWGEGHPKARASAQWESILGMPYLAAVDAETAWRAFEGMMSLVDDEGTMGGEGLPSRHAETAWLLHGRASDTGRLRAAYPAIKRLLLWKAGDPRWMHKGATSEGTKDSEFVSSAMRDMGFAARIADALGLPSEATFWRRQQAEMAADFRRWFWETPGGDPYEWYDAKTDKRWGKDSAWTLESLALPLPLLGADQRDSLLRLFRRLRDDRKPFLVPNLTKQPNISLTREGLSLHGLPGEAAAVAEAQMRDIALADTFAETYDQEQPLRGTGVRPSLFGALNIIDGVLFHNGMSLAGAAP